MFSDNSTKKQLFVKNGELSYAEMAEKVFKSYHKEMKVPELYDKMIDSGFKLKGKEPKNTLRGILGNYQKIFYKTKKAKWGLIKWNNNVS